jgi:hypothetical protein
VDVEAVGVLAVLPLVPARRPGQQQHLVHNPVRSQPSPHSPRPQTPRDPLLTEHPRPRLPSTPRGGSTYTAPDLFKST